ncbi:hypothetical protein KEN51_CDS0157 [Pseudomonas phage vB_Pae10145-KEN51]|uniref:PHIKZ223 n=5 Tax=Viruses TaxID=10239 RepID=Q8SCT9_BPDPK|nr:hypothetical protein [Pseudomonas aeruginosa]NP_803789.1 PHIKZ223 [Pseudomonas phage phiKZ]YP_009617428.1 hypothetical protein FDI90_gp140 [Pseudomonas phage PA7]ANM45026.1 hypothetical protein KTN4_268 [Pseudomonas phage KTN4]QGK89898.1 hypothetical protein [Pseudomonas phage vB_PA32_GUMS]QJB22903.1 hypothetical protein fnug_260 [Pseudomonas phage fnug]QOV08115.1 hypothetical protein [Pseudomonas phage vB_PaeM_kmuB]QYV99074.1 hypothetical protein [Pseudomonas phage T2P]QYV99424.1 hypoth
MKIYGSSFHEVTLEYGKPFIRNGVLKHLPDLGTPDLGWTDFNILEIIPGPGYIDKNTLNFYKERDCLFPAIVRFTVFEEERNRIISTINVDLAKKELEWNKTDRFWEIENFAIRFQLTQNPYSVLWASNGSL